ALILTPSLASFAAGAASSASSIVPQRLIASHTPAGAPYTPHEAGPMWNTCTASPNDTSTASSSATLPSLARVGACTKKSSKAGSSPPPATIMYPPAPSPVSSGSAANEVNIAATAASTALPPSRSTCAPASAVSGWPAATTPFSAVLIGE